MNKLLNLNLFQFSVWVLFIAMDHDDKIQLVQDSASNIWKVVREKTETERFWSGLKISCICISMVRRIWNTVRTYLITSKIFTLVSHSYFIIFQLLSVYSIILVKQFYNPIREEKRDAFDIHEVIDPMNQWFMDVEPELDKLIPQLDFPIVDCFRNKAYVFHLVMLAFSYKL